MVLLLIVKIYKIKLYAKSHTPKLGSAAFQKPMKISLVLTSRIWYCHCDAKPNKLVNENEEDGDSLYMPH